MRLLAYTSAYAYSLIQTRLHWSLSRPQAKAFVADPTAFAALLPEAQETQDTEKKEEVVETKKEESEEESDDDMGFGLFD